MTLKKYQIHNHNSGVVLGIFQGEDASAALDAMAREAGYRDYAKCCEAAPAREGEIIVREVVEEKACRVYEKNGHCEDGRDHCFNCGRHLDAATSLCPKGCGKGNDTADDAANSD